ncbi:DUF2971 domain-containing protein [Vibrio celticus]|uniref:DUF2971 domain-containing protein n=1 Tax=Vibrio celticus TaxID=446372 RepID=A0A1C3JH07_9VIBR|nr:DUF2971 domain-containing protein [Vibrio celticus]SBT14476.1 hypothetical protein VCE7224_03238 [Vibrio celticus]
MGYRGKVYKGDFKYKYVPYGDGAKAIINDATMKFTDPIDFNDPFDCSPSYMVGDFNELMKINQEAYKNAGRDLNLSPAQRIQEKGKMKARLQKALEDGSWKRTLQNSIGICSMTTKPCNLLMWAHYSNNHTGIVFEFSNVFPKMVDLKEFYLCAFHVNYELDKPVANLSEAHYGTDFLTKGIDWEYEDEIRCLNQEKKSGIHDYRRDLLKSVILGARIDSDDEADIRKLVKEVNQRENVSIIVYKAQMLDDKYKLIIPNHPVYGDPDW